MDLQLEFSHVDSRCALPFQKNTSTAATPRRCFRNETANFIVEACCSALHPGVLPPVLCCIHESSGLCPADVIVNRRIQVTEQCCPMQLNASAVPGEDFHGWPLPGQDKTPIILQVPTFMHAQQRKYRYQERRTPQLSPLELDRLPSSSSPSDCTER